jgi:hypothetical protein
MGILKKVSNARFLLLNDDWRGLVIEGSRDQIERIRKREEYWRHDLTAVAAFIHRDNVNGLFRDNGFGGAIGLLPSISTATPIGYGRRSTASNPPSSSASTTPSSVPRALSPRPTIQPSDARGPQRLRRPHELQAVELRHAHVGDQRVVVARLQLAQRLFALRDRAHP